MNLLPDVYCSEVELLEIRLHRLHEGENAGSLLGTRMQALFLQHCRRRDNPALGRAFFARYQRSLDHDAAFEEASYECENTCIRYPSRHLAQEVFVRHF